MRDSQLAQNKNEERACFGLRQNYAVRVTQSHDPFIRIHDAGQTALEGRRDFFDADAAGGHESFSLG
jgi:hypothetical protein